LTGRRGPWQVASFGQVPARTTDEASPDSGTRSLGLARGSPITLIVSAAEWNAEQLEDELRDSCPGCRVTRWGRNYRIVLDLVAASPEDARLSAEEIIKWTLGVFVVEVVGVELIGTTLSDVGYELGEPQESPEFGISL